MAGSWIRAFVVAAVARISFVAHVPCPRDSGKIHSVFMKEAYRHTGTVCDRGRRLVQVPVCIAGITDRDPICGSGLYVCGDRRRDGKYFLHLHDSDLYELLYHVLSISQQKMTKNFYRYVALGLACTYAIQVFLTIGRSMKMIPMTGVTLPFVSFRRKFHAPVH